VLEITGYKNLLINKEEGEQANRDPERDIECFLYLCG
jgi:hypothetical protein